MKNNYNAIIIDYYGFIETPYYKDSFTELVDILMSKGSLYVIVPDNVKNFDSTYMHGCMTYNPELITDEIINKIYEMTFLYDFNKILVISSNVELIDLLNKNGFKTCLLNLYNENLQNDNYNEVNEISKIKHIFK